MASMMQDVFTSYRPPEVPTEQRRCGGYSSSNTHTSTASLVGNVKGVGGVVEILKAKYGCSKGQRLRVLGDIGGPAGMWKLEDDKTVPKPHLKEGGWRWVMETEGQTHIQGAAA